MFQKKMGVRDEAKGQLCFCLGLFPSIASFPDTQLKAPLSYAFEEHLRTNAK